MVFVLNFFRFIMEIQNNLAKMNCLSLPFSSRGHQNPNPIILRFYSQFLLKSHVFLIVVQILRIYLTYLTQNVRCVWNEKFYLCFCDHIFDWTQNMLVCDSSCHLLIYTEHNAAFVFVDTLTSSLAVLMRVIIKWSWLKHNKLMLVNNDHCGGEGEKRKEKKKKWPSSYLNDR